MATGSGQHVLSRDRKSFRKLVDTIAEATEVRVFVGAGASLDAGLPAWNGLLKTFLENGFQEELKRGTFKGDGSEYSALARTVLESQDNLRAATVGRLLHGKKRDSAIQTALYDHHKEPPTPGRILTGIAQLAEIFEDKLLVLTTNYDDLLELEIARLGGGILPVAYVLDRAGNRSRVPLYEDGHVEVVHLHGFANFTGETYGELVLDERDYALAAASPGSVIPSALDPTIPTLFIGTSMTDPNLVAACMQLTSTDDEIPWFGLFVQDAALDPRLDKLVQGRIESMGVRPLNLASYGQISQVLLEIAKRIEFGEDYWSDEQPLRYGLRLEQWREDLLDTDTTPFVTRSSFDWHSDVHNRLANAVEQLDSEVLDTDHTENFGIHVWARSPNNNSLGELELLGSSTHLHRSAWSLGSRNCAIDGQSDRPVVQCLFNASTQHRVRSNDPTSRWHGVIAVPVESVEYGGIHIGAVSVSSTKPLDESVLRERATSVEKFLHEVGLRELDPRHANGPTD